MGTAGSENGGAGDGGGIANRGGRMLIVKSLISGNVAQGGSGYDQVQTGANADSASHTVAGIGPTGGTGGLALGGGIFNGFGTLDIQKSTISGNIARGGNGGAGGAGGNAADSGGPLYYFGGTGGTGGNGGIARGGGIFDSATMLIVSSTVSGNQAQSGNGGPGGTGGSSSSRDPSGAGGTGGNAGNTYGGGIASSNYTAATIVQKSTISGNSATLGSPGTGGTFGAGVQNGNTGDSGYSGYGYGGGISSSGLLLVQHTAFGTITGRAKTVSGNQALSGGGIAVLANATVTVQNSTFLGNTAGAGGGIYIADTGILNISNSAISAVHGVNHSGNSATHGGGGASSTLARPPWITSPSPGTVRTGMEAASLMAAPALP